MLQYIMELVSERFRNTCTIHAKDHTYTYYKARSFTGELTMEFRNWIVEIRVSQNKIST